MKIRFDLAVLLSIVLLLSLVINVVLFIRGRQYYLQLNETRLDPLGLDYYTLDADQRAYTNSHQVNVIFFGDSRAANWPPPRNLSQFTFINRGIGAQTSTQALHRFDYHVKPLHSQIIVVQVCINDLKTIPLFLSRKENIIANCEKNIQQIVERSVDMGATVILTTVFPIGEVPLERRLFWSDEVGLAINRVNDYISSLKGQQVIVFDTYSILAKNGVLQAEYAQDFLHLNEAGYTALNQEFVRILSHSDLSPMTGNGISPLYNIETMPQTR